MRLFFYVAFTILTFFCQIEAADKAKMLQDLEIIKSTFETRYAPYEWKKSYFGWSLEEEINIAKIKILSLDSLSVKDYQRILHAFFISTRDYHVHDEYYSTELALLPFGVNSVDGHYYITKIHKDLLQLMKKTGQYQGEQLPKVGDEIILFDSKPIAATIEEIKFQELGNPNSATAQRLAEEILTKRLGNRAHHIPHGSIEVRFCRSKKTFDAQIEWLHAPEKISNRSYMDSIQPLAQLAYNGNSAEKLTNEELIEDYEVEEASTLLETLQSLSVKPTLMINPLAHDLQRDHSAAFKKLLIEKLESTQDSPADFNQKALDSADFNTMASNKAVERETILFGEKIWDESPKSTFRVHIFKLPDSEKQIGYIRMATYMPSSEKKVVNQMVIRLAKSIRHLEENTDALIIDQIDNPGGIDLYAFAFIAMLTDRPLKLPLNQMTITQKEIAKALKIVESYEDMEDTIPDTPSAVPSLLFGYPFNQDFVKSETEFQSFLITQWDAGKTLTDAFPMHGIDKLPPHPLANYSKPILVLVNSNDFSCADFVPAILQDEKRAIIFGEKTAGAGGFVESHSYPNSFGLAEFSYTFSIAERIDGTVIENLGVTPDVPYVLNKKDLLHGYQGYIKAVNKTLKKMVTAQK